MPKRLRWIALLSLLVSGAVSTGVQAQVQRVVGRDGRVAYTDRPGQPPADAAGGAAQGVVAAPTAGLSYALAQVAQRYPVVLYASRDCAPCQSGRNLLINRGVPFNEKSVESNDDIAALRRLTGTQDLPVLTIGAQRIQGYSDGSWSDYLDAAGYPKTSQLSTSYRRPPATPLTVARAPAPTPTRVTADRDPSPTRPVVAPAPSATPTPSPTNPAGIRF